MKRPGIHFRLLLAAFFLIGATTLTLGHVGIGITHKFIRSRFEERMLFLAKYLALNTELGILIDERSMLRQLARNLLSEKDVIRVTILNSSDEVLADELSREAPGPLLVIAVPVVLKQSAEESLAFQWDAEEEPEDKVIGKVSISYSTEGVDGLLSIMRIRFLWLSAGMAVLAIVLFYFISRSLVAPVTNLAQAARKVAKGNLGFRVKPGRLPETRKLALAFNAMLDSLEKSSKALDAANQEMIRQRTLAEMGKFSLMIAHEVKNPLSIIKSSIDILKKDVDKPSGDTMIEYIEDEIRRLNRLIEDFLLFARPAMPNFRVVDVNAMLDECLVRFEFQSSDSAIEIRSDIPAEPCQARIDPDLLNRAVGNILKNAFEASGGRGVVNVTAFPVDDRWIVEIEDSGKGIDKKNIEKIFDPFFTTRSKGTGLGLAFAHQVVAAHKGMITAENRVGRGALFRITLPLEG